MVRYKPVPEPCDIDRLRRIHAAVPADAEATDDCCTRLCTVGPLSDRSAAREWLPFLTALDLVAQSADGYHRLDWQDQARLAPHFRANVLGARELLAAIETREPVTLEGLLEESVVGEATTPRTGETERELRVRRLLDWSERFGLVVEQHSGYRLSDG